MQKQEKSAAPGPVPKPNWTRATIRERGEVVVCIEDFGFTGEGYFRLDDGWLSVAGALPGELVRVAVQPGQRPGARRIFADLLEVIEASPDRRDPGCPFDRVCRGCQLRHLTVDAELRFKVRTVAEVIERFGGVPQSNQPAIEVITPQPIARGDAFRIRSSLTYRRHEGSYQLGLFSHASPDLIPMSQCPALTLPVQRLIAVIEKSLDRLRNLPWDQAMMETVRTQTSDLDLAPGVTHVAVAAPNHGVGLVDIGLTEVNESLPITAAVDCEPLKSWITNLISDLPAGVGLSAQSVNGERIYLKDPRRIRVPLGSWRMEVGFDDWFHANLEPAEQIYTELGQWIRLDASKRLLDVGCGTGTIALMLSPFVDEVVGLDANRSSIEAARINARSHGCDNTSFIAGGWEKGLRTLAIEQRTFDVATINPMREPLGRRPLTLLASLGVSEVLYLGPSPEAASRDIAILRDLGFALNRLGAVNLHPATYHTFLMAHLLRPE